MCKWVSNNMTSVVEYLLGYTKLDVPFNTDNQRTKHFFLQIYGARPRQKSGIVFSSKGVLKWKLPKNHFNKKCATKLLFFIEKK